jgi:taurine dioxygenase
VNTLATEEKVDDMVTVTPVAPVVGAEVSGLTLTPEALAGHAATLRRALHEYGVLFVRGRDVDDAAHKAFAAVFGELHVYPDAFEIRDPENPEFVVLASEGSDSELSYHQNGARAEWHTDATYEVCPPGAAVLRCLVPPKSGGGTLWAGMYGAWEGLSSRFQGLLEGLEALHTNEGLRKAHGDKYVFKSTTHPLVRTDPFTKKRHLYVSANHTRRILGMGETESDAVLRYLFDYVKDPALHVQLHWEESTIAVWEEHITQHCAVDSHVGKRVLRRLTVQGDIP